MKKTKIICSIGPASQEVDVMMKMVSVGMDVARINFSHGKKEETDIILNNIKEVRRLTGRHISILFDTKGPDLRTLEMQEGGINLIPGQRITITKETVIGTNNMFSVNHPEVLDKVNISNMLLLDDALIKLQVVAKDENNLICVVLEGGILSSKKGVNVPGVRLDLPFISAQDIEDISYSCQNEGDFLALSFVETKENVEEVRNLLRSNGRGDIQIISKIENNVALNNLDSIIDTSDGIMVARGDLGVEVSVQNLPVLQKTIIRKCREKGKLVIVATEMLASMSSSSRPTRAEVSDISNAVFDGTDAVMLSGESTVGKHPVEAVKYMADICVESENHPEYFLKFKSTKNNDVTEAIAAAVLSSLENVDVKAIVVPTTGGHSAKVISNLRPNPVVLAICPNEKVARKLTLNYGVNPIVVEHDDTSMDMVVDHSKRLAKVILKLNPSDKIIVTGGIHSNPIVKQTNFLKIEEI